MFCEFGHIQFSNVLRLCNVVFEFLKFIFIAHLGYVSMRHLSNSLSVHIFQLSLLLFNLEDTVLLAVAQTIGILCYIETAQMVFRTRLRKAILTIAKLIPLLQERIIVGQFDHD